MATIKGNKGMAASLMAHVKEVVPVDDLTFDIVTEGGYAATPASTAFFFFLPPRVLRGVGGQGRFRPESHRQRALPFRRMARGRPHHASRRMPPTGAPRPQIPALTFRAQPETATRVALLETGEADLITGVPPELIDHVQQFADVKTARALRRVFCFFNCFVPPTDNPLVRKAINYAIDVESLVKYVLEGHAYPAKGINKPGYLGYAPEKLGGIPLRSGARAGAACGGRVSRRYRP